MAKIDIGGTLHSTALGPTEVQSNVVTNADEVLDVELNKKQDTINSELTSDVSDLKTAVGTGGSVDSRIAETVNVEKTRAEGAESTLDGKIAIEKTRAEAAEGALDGRVDTLEDVVGTGGSVDSRISAAVDTETTRAQGAESNLQELYEGLTQSNIAVVDILPATGEAYKIYRLVGTNSYADYMYNSSDLTTPIKMAQYDNAIDNEPTYESNNLVKSGGVFETSSQFLEEVEYNKFTSNSYWSGSVGQTISTGTSSSCKRFNAVPIRNNCKIDFSSNLTGLSLQCGYICDKDLKVLKIIYKKSNITSEIINVNNPEACYFCMNSYTSSIIKITGSIIGIEDKVENNYAETQVDIDNTKSLINGVDYNYLYNTGINSSGQIIQDDTSWYNTGTSEKISVSAGDKIEFFVKRTASYYRLIVCDSSNNVLLTYASNSGDINIITAPTNANYFRFAFAISEIDNIWSRVTSSNGVTYWKPINASSTLEYSREVLLTKRLGTSGYIGTGGSIGTSSVSYYFKFKAKKGETIKFVGYVNNSTTVIATTLTDVQPLTPRITTPSNHNVDIKNTYTYTLTEDCIVYICYYRPDLYDNYFQVIGVDNNAISDLALCKDVKIFDEEVSYTVGNYILFLEKDIKKYTKLKLEITQVSGDFTGGYIGYYKNGTVVGTTELGYVTSEPKTVIVTADSDQLGIRSYNSSTNGKINLKISIITDDILGSDVFYNFKDLKSFGEYGFISYSTGEISTSQSYKYVTFDLKAGQAVAVNCYGINSVAVISTKIGDEDLTPRVPGTNTTTTRYYTVNDDCTVYVCYEVTSPFNMMIYPDFNNSGILINKGPIVDNYYKCLQTTFTEFPDKQDTTTAQVYAAYDSLLSLSSLFTREQIGLACDNTTPLYAYKFTPYRASSYPAWERTKLPTIMIMCGQHGFEKCNVLGTYYFIKDLITNYKDDPVLSYLHSHVELRVIAVANPTGFDANTYINSNGVNLNRNWDVINWASQGSPGDNQYGGIAPFDQPETDAINEYFKTFKDNCLLVIDSHSQGSTNVDHTYNINWITMPALFTEYKRKIVSAVFSHASALTENFLIDYDASKFSNDGITVPGFCCRISPGPNKLSPSYLYGNADVYFTQKYNLGVTLEGFNGFPSEEGSGVTSTYTENVYKGNAEIMCNFIMAVLREF